MYNPSYHCPECKIYLIAERSSQKDYGSRLKQLKLSELKDDELAAIRTALYKITRRRILNVTDAEDLVQETLMTMITRYPGDKLKKGLLVWSQGILRNKVGNYYRKAKRQDSLKEAHSSFQQQEIASWNIASPEATVSNKELHAIIEDKLAEFSPAERRVMELLISGFKAGEIADTLSSEPYQNIINHLYRGRKKLARELIKCGFGPNGRKTGHRKRPGKAGARLSQKVS